MNATSIQADFLAARVKAVITVMNAMDSQNERLADDLTHQFGREFSRQNLWQMRAFHQAWPDAAILQTVSGESVYLTKLLADEIEKTQQALSVRRLGFAGGEA
jgi:DUF1016 N-terminal domain